MVLETAEKETNSSGLRAPIKNRVETTKLAREAVERDFVSGTVLTYLELFVNDLLVSESIEKGDLSSSKVKEAKTLVGRLKFLRSTEEHVQSQHPERRTLDPETDLLTIFLPEIGNLLLVRRLQERHWKETKPAGVELEHWQETKPAEFELTLQRHQQAFFPKEISYTPLP